MKKIQITGINYELLEELNLNNCTRNQDEINEAIEMMKRNEYLKETIRELDIQELKKIDALLNRTETTITPASIKDTDLSAKGVDLFAAIVKGVHLFIAPASTYPNKETIAYNNLKQNLLEANGDKRKKFEVARNAMAILRGSTSEKRIEAVPVLKK